MFSHRAFRKRIPDVLFGELEGRRREMFDRHRDTCTPCAEEFARAAKAVYLAGQRSRPDPGQAFWDGYWDRLEKRLAEEEKRPFTVSTSGTPPKRRFSVSPVWAVPAAAGLLIAGVLVGRFVLKTDRTVAPFSAIGAAQVVPANAATDLAARTSLYLDRSKRILLSIINCPPPEKADRHGLNLPGQKAASRALVLEAASLKQDLGQAKERRLERLVGDLENILLQIANLESSSDLAAVDIIRAGAESRDILFQINLAELRGAGNASGTTKPAAPARREKTIA
jgi:hypothetical protein